MKIRMFAAFLLAVLMVPILSGCSLWTMEARLDALEDAVENRVDAVEDAVENAVVEAIRPEPVPLAPAPAQPQPTEPKPTEAVPPSTEAPAEKLTKEEAEAIALAHAGFAADQVRYLRTEFEIDDRIPQYDVQFHEGYWEYEFEIHAETGTILSFDKDN